MMIFLFLLSAQFAHADTRVFVVPTAFDTASFISSAAAQGINFEAGFSSDTPHGELSYDGNQTLTLNLFEAPKSADKVNKTRWTPGRTSVSDLSAAWTVVSSILGQQGK